MLLTSCARRIAKYVANFSNHLQGLGSGGPSTSCSRGTSKYVTNFSNHLHGVGWGEVAWVINVFCTKNFQPATIVS